LLLERLRMNDEIRHVWQDVSIFLFWFQSQSYDILESSC
jgi:hypothetical protein